MYGDSDGTDCSNSQLDEVFVGSGSAGDPFLIESESDLQRISGCTFAGKFLKQTVDITTSDPAPVKDGAFNLPNGLSVGLPGPYKFRGTYDGNGKSITFDLRNTSCSLGIQFVGCGVFRQTEAAEIKNLTIDASNAGGPGIAGITPNFGGWLVATDYMRPDDSIYRGIARPYNFSLFSGIKVFGDLLTGAGGIVGSAQGTHIYNSSMTGKFVGNSAGGIVGQFASNVTIRRSSSSVDPNGTLLGGGIVGPYSEGVSVIDVYSTGDVTLGGGGIVGPNSIDAEVQNCYVTGNIPSTEDGFDHAAGGVIGADATVSDSDHRITVRNCYTTGSIGTGAGGIIGNLAPDSEVSVYHSFTSGVSSNYPMGVIYADNTSINDTGGAYFGEGNYSNGNASPSPGFQLSKFVDFVATEYGAWNNGSFTNATWALCASVHPTLPYLTAHYASDPCAVINPPSSPTTVAPVLQQTPVTTIAPNKNFPPTAKPVNINIGQVTMAIGDAITPVSRTPETTGAGFRLSGGGIEVQTNPPPQGFTSGGTSLLTLFGFSPSSQIGVFLFSSPISVGSLFVKSDGIARGTITLPTSVPPGSHTLQFTGWTKSNEPIVLSAGINVQPQVRSLQKSVNFSTGIAHMSSAGRNTLLRLIGESGALVGPAQTVITYSTSGNKSQVRLAQLRAYVIEKFLKLNDMPGTIRIKGINSYQLQDPRILIIRTNG